MVWAGSVEEGLPRKAPLSGDLEESLISKFPQHQRQPMACDGSGCSNGSKNGCAKCKVSEKMCVEFAGLSAGETSKREFRKRCFHDRPAFRFEFVSFDDKLMFLHAKHNFYRWSGTDAVRIPLTPNSRNGWQSFVCDCRPMHRFAEKYCLNKSIAQQACG